MNSLGRAWRPFLKRHSEAIFILAFLIADCFLSGWPLAVGTVAAVLYVILPAIRTLPSLDPKGRITFVKAFVRTAKMQRLGFFMVWIYSTRFFIYAATKSCLYTSTEPSTTESSITSALTALIAGAQNIAPIAFLTTPLYVYAAASLIAIGLRSRLKATKQDPDLISQRQRWAGTVHALLVSAFIGSILSITLNVNGPSYMISNWLLASGRDANLWSGFETAQELVDWQKQNPAELSSPDTFDPSVPVLQGVAPDHPVSEFIGWFDTFIICTTSLILFVVFLQPVLKLNAFLSSFCWRVVSPKSLQNVIEGFLEALRLPSRALNYKEAHPVITNAGRTFGWLVVCYVALFWLFGFCEGPLGTAIHNWMLASIVDAGFVTDGLNSPDWLFDSRMRIFLGAIVALYGTAPIAVTAAIFLPHAKARKMILNCDGILFLHGPYLALWGRQFRLWSDLKKLSVQRSSGKGGRLRARFSLTFRSGGCIRFNNTQVNVQDLKVLLDSIDQHAINCEVDPEVLEVCRLLREADADADADGAASDGGTDTSIIVIPAQEFKSTVFVPLSSGEFVPSTEIRVIKQLSSKPLCAVYLGRNEEGRMVTIKQFYLPDETDEVKALAKILNREYELLTRLDHPGIAKVLNTLSVEKSTYLVIEHRVGIDLREAVQEHGPRSEALTIAWAKQICEIMIYLHERETAILHRDLTPDNIIAGEDGQLRLIDFGAAREFLDGITGTMIGKHCFVSPEQLRGEATTRSDIYSFGGTLYFLLTGRDPLALSQSSPAKSLACSDELDQLVKDCTEFELENRPQSFREILDRLNNMNKGRRLKVAAREKVLA